MSCHGQIDLVDGIGNGLVHEAQGVAEVAGQAALRHDSRADLAGDEHDGRSLAAQRPDEALGRPLPVVPVLHQVGHPERQAVDDPRAPAVGAVKRAREIGRLFQGRPFRAAPGAVLVDAGRHLGVPGAARGDVDGGAVPRRPALRKPALPGARAAGNEYRHSHGRVTLQKSVVKKSERPACSPPQTSC